MGCLFALASMKETPTKSHETENFPSSNTAKVSVVKDDKKFGQKEYSIKPDKTSYGKISAKGKVKKAERNTKIL